MIVLDASVLIAHFGAGDPHAADALEILDTEEELAIHPLTLAEVLVRPAGQGRAAAVREQIALLGVDVLDFSADHALLLAELRASTGLRMPDCCVLLAAMTTSSSVATFDRRLADVAAQLGIPSPRR